MAWREHRSECARYQMGHRKYHVYLRCLHSTKLFVLQLIQGSVLQMGSIWEPTPKKMRAGDYVLLFVNPKNLLSWTGASQSKFPTKLAA